MAASLSSYAMTSSTPTTFSITPEGALRITRMPKLRMSKLHQTTRVWAKRSSHDQHYVITIMASALAGQSKETSFSSLAALNGSLYAVLQLRHHEPCQREPSASAISHSGFVVQMALS